MKKGLYILAEHAMAQIYGEREREEIAARVDLYAPPQTAETVRKNPSILEDCQVIFSGWGGPRMDGPFLSRASRLEIVFYGAGSVRNIVSDEFWNRGLRITSACAANAVPVAEFTLAQVLFSLKHGWKYVWRIKSEGRFPAREPVPGAYGSTVGILSLGMIGARVCQRLRDYDLKVLAYDPFADARKAAELGVELCGLDDVFRRSDVVSLHTPWLKETENMVRGRHFALMKPGATFLNTARGAIVCEPEMIEVLQQRPDLFAVLDVTHPEPPVPGSPLYTLPNVVLTPHIAGSMAGECRRMGRYMVDELDLFLAGKPMRWEISREKAQVMA